MVERRAIEAYYLVVLGLIIVVLGLASAFAAAIGLQRTLDLAAGRGGWPDGPLGLLLAAGLFIATWGLTRLYRLIERRGLIHPPRT